MTRITRTLLLSRVTKPLIEVMCKSVLTKESLEFDFNSLNTFSIKMSYPHEVEIIMSLSLYNHYFEEPVLNAFPWSLDFNALERRCER